MNRIRWSLSLRNTVTLALLSGFAGLFGLVYGISATTLINSHIQLETKEVRRNAERAEEAYERYGETQEQILYQWAVWDDTYEFVQNPTQRYIDRNLNHEVFSGFNANLIAFFGPSGQMVYGAVYDWPKQGRFPIPRNFVEYLRQNPRLLQGRDPRKPLTGVIAISDAVMIASFSPILKSDVTGSTRGTLVMARILDADEAKEVSQQTRQQVRSFPINQPLSNEQMKIVSRILQGEATVIEYESDTVIHAYRILRDLSGRPALLIQTTLPRPIYQQGLRSLYYLLLTLGGITLFLGIVIFLLYQKLLIFWDEQKVDRSQLAWQASRDPLTGIFNRREFERSLEASLQDGDWHSLCYLDLDKLKVINDTCGHNAGDELLRQIANVLQSQLRATDVIARLGGDEFGVLLRQTRLEEASQIAARLNQSVREYRFVWQDKVFVPGVSIGVMSFGRGGGQTLASILSAADAACYVAKSQGRNRVQVHQTGDEEVTRQRKEMEWVSELTKALSEERFCLFYQSILPIRSPEQETGEHYEVLLRLRDNRGGLIAPGAFIPAAERYGLMPLLDRWVIHALFSRFAAHYRQVWREAYLCNRSSLFAINLSGASLSDQEFGDFLQDQLNRYRIPPRLICFEITETTAINHLERATRFIQRFKALGCQFALDDFGSGMSSFSYLKELPVDLIKIDGAFVKDMLTNPAHLAIVESINQVAHVMGLRTVAEYVEGGEVLEKLREIGIDFAQGYGIAHPQPLEARATKKIHPSPKQALPGSSIV